jgi:hypothetical protein
MEAVMNRRTCIITLAIGCLLVLFASSAVFAAVKVKASGIMTSLEDDGTVIIKKIISINKSGEKSQSTGYLLSPSVVVQDQNGGSISLNDIALPYNVDFEYEYTPKGFMITLIKKVAG